MVFRRDDLNFFISNYFFTFTNLCVFTVVTTKDSHIHFTHTHPFTVENGDDKNLYILNSMPNFLFNPKLIVIA